MSKIFFINTWGKSSKLAETIWIVESSFFKILKALIVFALPRPAMNDLLKKNNF